MLSLSRHHHSHGEMLKAAVCMVAGDPSRVPNDRHAKQRGMGCSFPNRVKDFADGHEPRLLAHLRSSSSFLALIWRSYPLIKVCSFVWSCFHLNLILTTPPISNCVPTAQALLAHSRIGKLSLDYNYVYMFPIPSAGMPYLGSETSLYYQISITRP